MMPLTYGAAGGAGRWRLGFVALVLASSALLGCDSHEAESARGGIAQAGAQAGERHAETSGVSAALEDGLLRIEWDAYGGAAEFQAYWIRIARASGVPELVSVKDVGATAWVDSAYVAGAAVYSVETEWAGGSEESAPVTVNYQPPRVVDHALSPEGATVAWTKLGAYGNFERYVLERAEVGSGAYEVVAELESVEDTTFSDDVRIPLGSAGVVYRVRTDARAEAFAPPGTDRLGAAHVVRRGEPFVEFGSWTHILNFFDYDAADLYLSRVSGRGIARYDAATMERRAYRSDLSTVRRAGAAGFAVSRSTSWPAADAVHLLDPQTLQTISTYTINDLINRDDHEYLAGFLSVAEDGRVAFAANWYDSPRTYLDAVYVVDLTTGRRLARIDDVGLPRSVLISKNGRHVTKETAGWGVWTIGVQGGRTFRGQFYGGFTFVDGGERFAHAEDGVFRLLSATDLQVVAEYAVPEVLMLHNHDPLSGLIAATYYEEGAATCRVFDAETGEVVYEAPVEGDVAVHGGRLFSVRGYVVELPTAPARVDVAVP